MTRDIYDEAQRLLRHARKPQALEDAERAVIRAAGRCVHGEDTGGGVNYETGESEPGEMLPPFHPDLCRNLEEKWRALKEATDD